jgi:hypothetical protein
VAGIAATAAAGTLLPASTIARDSGGASEGLAYRTAGDLVKALADRQVSSRELLDGAISARLVAFEDRLGQLLEGLFIAKLVSVAEHRRFSWGSLD